MKGGVVYSHVVLSQLYSADAQGRTYPLGAIVILQYRSAFQSSDWLG